MAKSLWNSSSALVVRSSQCLAIKPAKACMSNCGNQYAQTVDASAAVATTDVNMTATATDWLVSHSLALRRTNAARSYLPSNKDMSHSSLAICCSICDDKTYMYVGQVNCAQRH